MKIVFNEEFYKSDYSDDGAAASGRMESIIDEIKKNSKYPIISNKPADYSDILRVHTKEYISSIHSKSMELYDIALLSAGGAILSSQLAMREEVSFACIRPPGHHAYKAMGWGYCYFCNMAIALKKLKDEGKINSAFILDFDAHTGDGTIDCLSDWKEAIILNPMAENRSDYLKLFKNFIKELPYVDIIAVCAGFDIYEKDVGRKLTSFDFYQIGFELKLLSRKMGHNRRFAILEGGYYQPDLGKNVLSFCQGFE